MIESTISKLSAMRLHAMADKTREMANSPKLSSMNPLDFLAFLVDAEFDRRESGKVSRLLRKANIKQTMACIENVEFSARRNLKKEVLVDVLTGTFLENKNNA